MTELQPYFALKLLPHISKNYCNHHIHIYSSNMFRSDPLKYDRIIKVATLPITTYHVKPDM